MTEHLCSAQYSPKLAGMLAVASCLVKSGCCLGWWAILRVCAGTFTTPRNARLWGVAPNYGYSQQYPHIPAARLMCPATARVSTGGRRSQHTRNGWAWS